MVDLLDVSAGRMRIRDTDGTVVFDTNQRLFCATDQNSGSISFGSYSASNTNSVDTVSDVTNFHLLAYINGAADTVRGSFSVTTGSGGALTGLGWYNASGTYVHYFDAMGAILGGGSRSLITQIASYTFLASGGGLYLRERIYLKADISLSPSVTYTVTLLPVTLQFNLLCGTFV